MDIWILHSSKCPSDAHSYQTGLGSLIFVEMSKRSEYVCLEGQHTSWIRGHHGGVGGSSDTLCSYS